MTTKTQTQKTQKTLVCEKGGCYHDAKYSSPAGYGEKQYQEALCGVHASPIIRSRYTNEGMKPVLLTDESRAAIWARLELWHAEEQERQRVKRAEAEVRWAAIVREQWAGLHQQWTTSIRMELRDERNGFWRVQVVVHRVGSTEGDWNTVTVELVDGHDTPAYLRIQQNAGNELTPELVTELTAALELVAGWVAELNEGGKP